MLYEQLQESAARHFKVKESDLPRKVGRPLYSHLYGTLRDEPSYREVDHVKNLRSTVEKWLSRYEESNGHALNVPVFDFMIEQLIKINRAIQQPQSSVILVGLPGLGQF